MSEQGHGRLIAFEGGEATGKSTQARLLAERLDAVLTREPGGTAVGEHIRSILLDRAWESLSPRAEALLLVADRAQHVAEVVLPATESGRDVVSDRFSASLLAYQGFGHGLDLTRLRDLSSWSSGGLEPDLTVLMEVPEDVATARVRDTHRDRFEAMGEGFHRRVAKGYRELAAADSDRWLVVDGSGSVEDVAARVWEGFSRWATVGGRSGAVGR